LRLPGKNARCARLQKGALLTKIRKPHDYSHSLPLPVGSARFESDKAGAGERSGERRVEPRDRGCFSGRRCVSLLCAPGVGWLC